MPQKDGHGSWKSSSLLGSSTRETQAAVSRKEEHHGAGANSRGALQSSRGAQIPWAHRTGPGHFDLKELG